MIRIFDILFSAIGLVILSPLFILIAILIKITSKGPIFYKQQRVGKLNKDIQIYKFRTMYLNSEKKGLLTIGKKDPRVTTIGVFLRRFKLDEIPQLINVFVGNMSLVGPRPEVRKYVNLYSENQKIVLNILPGITDYASIEYANENEIISNFEDPERAYIKIVMPAKLSLNMNYINNRSVSQYFKIIFLTLLKIIKIK